MSETAGSPRPRCGRDRDLREHVIEQVVARRCRQLGETAAKAVLEGSIVHVSRSSNSAGRASAASSARSDDSAR